MARVRFDRMRPAEADGDSLPCDAGGVAEPFSAAAFCCCARAVDMDPLFRLGDTTTSRKLVSKMDVALLLLSRLLPLLESPERPNNDGGGSSHRGEDELRGEHEASDASAALPPVFFLPVIGVALLVIESSVVVAGVILPSSSEPLIISSSSLSLSIPVVCSFVLFPG